MTPWSAARQASLSFTVSQSLLKLMSIELVMLSNHLIFFAPFSCPQSFLASGYFPMSQLFESGGQSIGASASASSPSNKYSGPINIQGWFPLGLTGLISLLSKALSRVFVSTIVWKHQFFGAQPSLWSNSCIRMIPLIFFGGAGQDRVPPISVLLSSPFKQGICLPRLVQHMSCKISVNAPEETHEMNTLGYNPPDSAKSQWFLLIVPRI